MDPAAVAAVAETHRRDWGFVLAATARITRDLDAAEDCVQDAYAQALAAWLASGVPAKPTAWLTVVARWRAMNLIHRNDTLARKLPLLVSGATSTLTGRCPERGTPRVPARGLSFGLIHPRPQQFTGDHGRLPALIRDARERW